ncbi:MAG: VanW family protein [Patescibacteria group bacterium]
MKKYRKFLAVVFGSGALFILFLITFNAQVISRGTSVGTVSIGGLSIEEARNTLEEAKNKHDVILSLGGNEARSSYEKLGVDIDVERALTSVATESRFAMASLFHSQNDKKKLSPHVAVDEKVLKQAILSLFPFLKDSEEASEQFFVTSNDQAKFYTFNLPKLKEQLAYGSKNLQDSEIEVEMLPYDYSEEPTKTPEEIETLKNELKEKEIILRTDADDLVKLEWKINLKETQWLIESKNGVSLDKELLREYILQNIVGRVERSVQDATIKTFVPSEQSEHIEVEGIARDGISIPIDENLEHIQKSIAEGTFEIFLKINRTPSFVYNETNVDLGELELLSTGKSNFVGSPDGRSFNIQKGLREKMNNIIVPPGGTFAFNSFLKGFSAREGWKMALGIVGGGTLTPILGAGLCQVSTTVYRAALFAGLPIEKRKSHSLYVKYYKEYGEGLDAAIFLGSQDLIFKNDTPSYLFIQAYDDGQDAYVKIYGTSDSREVRLDGPYRTKNIPKEKVEKYSSTPRKNEIFWFRTVEKNDGTATEEQIISRYKTLPN